MSYDYRGRVAIVTGVSSGIGRAVALDLAARGAIVVGVARRQDLLEEVMASCRLVSPDSLGIPCDVSDRPAIERVVAETVEKFGKIDILVNNAGVSMRVHAMRVTPEDVEHVMSVNFMGTVYATLAALPGMVERRSGHIVNIASVAGRLGSPREAAYAASKFAVTGWSEVLAIDLDGTGVHVHVVYPGPIETEIWQKIAEPASYRGRMYPPEDIATGVRECIEKNRFDRWVPRHYAIVPYLRALAPRAFARQAARFDRMRAGR